MKELDGKAAFLKLAAETYDRMMVEEQEGMITFTQREDRVLEVGAKLEQALIEAHLVRELKEQEESRTQPCPDCQKPSVLKIKARTRRLQTRIGPVSVSRAIYYCRCCRRSFSPSGPATRVDRGRL